MRRSIFLAATGMALTAPLAAAAQPAPLDREMRFAIPASDLRSGISAFSRATGIQVIVAASDAAGRRSMAVSGQSTARAALATMLRGTGLEPTMKGSLIVLRPHMTAAAPDTRPAPTPAALDVPAAEIAAREPEADTGQEIVVTGYRASLQRAQDLKRRAVNSQDNILAQDIAAFPDLNLAESLQRVPGITITRDAGEGRQITLRGLGPDFTRTQLNGMEALGNTASGMDNRGSVSRARSFDFSLFASELFNRVTVQKSFSAEQDDGGIAGTVQLYTARPFDYDGAKTVLSAKAQTNTNTDTITPRVIALTSHRWGDFGALVSVAYGRIRSNEYGFRNWGWSRSQYGAANVGPDISAADRAKLTASGDNRLFAPQAQSPSSWYTDRQRVGVTTALQYHPGTKLKLDLDLLYGRLSDYRDNYAIASAGTNALTGDVKGTQKIQSAVIQGNSLVAGSYTGVDLRTEHNTMRNYTDFYQAVLNGRWDATDRLSISGLAGYQQSNFRQPEFDKVFLESKNRGIAFDMRPNMPTVSYNFDVTDPNNWQLMRLDAREDSITNSYANGKLDAAYALDQHSTFKIGGEFKHFVNSGYQYSSKVFYNTPTDRVIPNSLKFNVDRDSLFLYIVGDVPGTYAQVGQTRDLNQSYLTAGTDYRVSEKTVSAYAQYDLDTDVAGFHTRANIGVRYYSTDLVSSGQLNTGTSLQPVSVGTNSHGWLPAANLAIDLTDKAVLRLSANRNVNRPALGSLAAAGTLTTAPFGGSINVGNPYLKPFKATSIEGGMEYYIDKSGYASIGFFYKDMDSFITSETSTVPYSATGFPLSLLLPGQGGDTPYNFSRPINGPGANIKGIEAAFQHDFNFLPAPFDKLGAVVNGTYFDGHQDVIYSGKAVRLPLYNLSRWAANATLYYETPRWGVRVSEAYRSRYLIGSGGNGNIGEGIKPTSNVDFQAHVALLPRLKLVVEGINLTDQHIRQYTDVATDRFLVDTSSGRTFTLGLTADF